MPTVNFASDNWAGVTPEVMAALARANEGFAKAYGEDALTGSVTRRFAEVFEHEVEVWFTATGTAANSLSLAAAGRPGGVVFCSDEAHIHSDESGATEFQSGGMKLMPIAGTHGVVAPADLAAALAKHPPGWRSLPVALSLTNVNESGMVYGPAEIAALSAVARSRGVAVHIDGARFANAVAATGATPAELTWKAGVDFMSFGGTKNGCWAAEAIVVFSPDRLRDLAERRQRAGHTFSKSRFIAAQFEAYLENDNWLRWAGHANGMADRLRAGIRQSGKGRLAWENAANEVFAVIGKGALERVLAAGGMAYHWPGAEVATDEVLVRLVTSWATRADEVERFLGML